MGESNFDILKKYLPEIASFGDSAEGDLYDNPTHTIADLRKFAENIVKEILKKEGLNFNDNFYENLILLEKMRVVPESILTTLHSLRKHGNIAHHGNYENIEMAKNLLIESHRFGNWYIRNYENAEHELHEFDFHIINNNRKASMDELINIEGQFDKKIEKIYEEISSIYYSSNSYNLNNKNSEDINEKVEQLSRDFSKFKMMTSKTNSRDSKEDKYAEKILAEYDHKMNELRNEIQDLKRSSFENKVANNEKSNENTWFKKRYIIYLLLLIIAFILSPNLKRITYSKEISEAQSNYNDDYIAEDTVKEYDETGDNIEIGTGSPADEDNPVNNIIKPIPKNRYLVDKQDNISNQEDVKIEGQDTTSHIGNEDEYEQSNKNVSDDENDGDIANVEINNLVGQPISNDDHDDLTSEITQQNMENESMSNNSTAKADEGKIQGKTELKEITNEIMVDTSEKSKYVLETVITGPKGFEDGELGRAGVSNILDFVSLPNGDMYFINTENRYNMSNNYEKVIRQYSKESNSITTIDIDDRFNAIAKDRNGNDEIILYESFYPTSLLFNDDKNEVYVTDGGVIYKIYPYVKFAGFGYNLKSGDDSGLIYDNKFNELYLLRGGYRDSKIYRVSDSLKQATLLAANDDLNSLYLDICGISVGEYVYIAHKNEDQLVTTGAVEIEKFNTFNNYREIIYKNHHGESIGVYDENHFVVLADGAFIKVNLEGESEMLFAISSVDMSGENGIGRIHNLKADSFGNLLFSQGNSIRRIKVN